MLCFLWSDVQRGALQIFTGYRSKEPHVPLQTIALLFVGRLRRWRQLFKLVTRLRGVDSVVPLEAGEASERLGAELTVVRLVASVRARVRAQGDGLSEALGAVLAFEGLFACVDARVSAQVRVLGERFVAVLTSERSVSGVGSDVVAKMRRLAEGFVAVDALEALLFLAPLVAR